MEWVRYCTKNLLSPRRTHWLPGKKGQRGRERKRRKRGKKDERKHILDSFNRPAQVQQQK